MGGDSGENVFFYEHQIPDGKIGLRLARAFQSILEEQDPANHQRLIEVAVKLGIPQDIINNPEALRKVVLKRVA